ncbi:MAG: glutamine--fructose-6-phosphate transaminase (isomerizing) [Myxococcales bacterium]|nr:glutamine--fructose-6-phosphate transaminase (isomerizing) [Myxococcales bacterium]MDD9967267.1 glutamine--fructose-6-phosphate transaminase (isomerizing) [Myxococcales bacterium]
MCGIVGYIGTQQCVPILIDGLRKLEYRGYDSAGLAIHDGKGIELVRAVGKLRALEEATRERNTLEGTLGIGHTRWATHGGVSEENAHPHVAGDIALIHNGIIENHSALRKRLEGDGAAIASDTDTEIVAHLVDAHVRAGKDLVEGVRDALQEVEGAYAIAVVSRKDPSRLVVAKNASPLVLGVGDGENFAGSDIPALLEHTRRMVIMEDGQMAVLRRDGIELFTLSGDPVEVVERRVDWSPVMAEKAGYKHFMLKEIFEQPRAIEDTLRGRLERELGDINSAEIGLTPEVARSIKRVCLIACGTSHHAAMTGHYYFEQLAGIPTVVELASEFRARDPLIGDGDMVVAISQSGETLDTLMGAKIAKDKGAHILAIANVTDSAIPRMADGQLYTRAGPEIGVASTKCFTAQLLALLMLAIYVGRQNKHLSDEQTRDLVEELARLPLHMRDVLTGTRQLVSNIARRYKEAQDVLFLGRGLNFPIALEGALKLKEISYVHAEGYAAGEMKHGPIALIDASVPVVVLLPKDSYRDKSLGNLQEAKARGGRMIVVASEGDEDAHATADEVVEVPVVNELLAPFLTVLPLQLYAYYVADMKGTDVDQPRNLAKTVTVE